MKKSLDVLKRHADALNDDEIDFILSQYVLNTRKDALIRALDPLILAIFNLLSRGITIFDEVEE